VERGTGTTFNQREQGRPAGRNSRPEGEKERRKRKKISRVGGPASPSLKKKHQRLEENLKKSRQGHGPSTFSKSNKGSKKAKKKTRRKKEAHRNTPMRG